MKRFLIKTIAFGTALILVLTAIFLLIPSGRIGDVYPRIISPKQSSIVIGTSRAAQGINPDILDSALIAYYPAELYNFAFHIDLSTYNEGYAKAIGMKLKPKDNANHYFILTVDPWAMNADIEQSTEFNITSVSRNPNIEYIVKNFTRYWFTPLPTHTFVNDKGRTEVDYKAHNGSDKLRHIEERLNIYRKKAHTYQYSEESESILSKLISDLSQRGDVFLVRMPTSQGMLDIENAVCPLFSEKMSRIANAHNVDYFDFTGEEYDTSDGNHLTFEEGNRFSTVLADSIKEQFVTKHHFMR